MVRCVAGHVEGLDGQKRERRENRQRAHEAELLAHDGEHEVVVGLGQIRVLHAAHAKPHAREPSRAKRHEAARELVAVAPLVAPGIEHREDALTGVIVPERVDETNHRNEQGKLDEDVTIEARVIGDDEHEQADDARRALVGLDDDEQDRQAHVEGETLDERRLVDGALGEELGRRARGRKQHEHLRELRGLQP